jgi:hypothetical protein
MLTLCVPVKKLGLAFLVGSGDDELVLELGGRASDSRYGILEAAVTKR